MSRIPLVRSSARRAGWRIYRSRGEDKLLIAIGGFGAIFAIGGFVELVGTEPADTASAVIGIGGYLGFWAGIAYLLLRALRAGVYVAGDDVVVVGLVVSRWLDWSEIEAFSVDSWPSTGRVHLCSGDSIAILGINAPNPLFFPRSTGASEPVERLNRLLEDRRGEMESEHGRSREPV